MRERIPLLVVISLFLSFLIFIPLFAQNATVEKDNSPPLKTILNPDGTLKQDMDFHGNLDPTGYRMKLDENGRPRFVPEETEPAYPTIPTSGDANWDDQFTMAGANDYIYAIAVNGSDMYIGGDFTMVGTVYANHIAHWNGSTWHALGGGVNGRVYCITVDGSNVYAGGSFTIAGSTPASRIAAWNGSMWSAMGEGFNGTVYAITKIGSIVYAGGAFSQSGITTMNNISQWNGSAWLGMNGGMNNTVHALATDGSNLYAGGWFSSAGGSSVSNVARWNGSTWSALGSGISGGVLAIFIDGSDVYVGGDFSQAGGISAQNIAKWNGTTWSALGSGVGSGGWGHVETISMYSGQLHVGCRSMYTSIVTGGGFFEVANVHKWNGSDWTQIAEFTDGRYGNPKVYALAEYGGYLYAGGEFSDSPNRVGDPFYSYYIPDLHARGIARWNGTVWDDIDSENSVNSTVKTIAIIGNDVYVGGGFTEAGGSTAKHIVKWNGSSWQELGDGMIGYDWTAPVVNAIALDGTDLYIGGVFTDAGSTPAANNVAKWDGSWSALGSGLPDSDVNCLAVDGLTVYAGRTNAHMGGIPDYIMQWNGSTWNTVGGGVSCPYWWGVMAVAVSGSDLYIGGDLDQAGTIPIDNIARWDGANWWDLDMGLDDQVYAIAIDGSDVYVGGKFTMAGGISANHIARWDGAAWHALGTGVNNDVRAIAVDGSNIYAGGAFTTAGGISANHIAIWDGSTWYPMGSGTDNTVYSIAVSPWYIYVGGYFKMAGAKPSNYFGRWYKGIPPIDQSLIKVPYDYSTIQDAIDVATNGDTILVSAGNFYINSTILNDHVNNLLIMGSRDSDGKNASIIKANANPGTYACVRFQNVSGCTFSGFEIMDGSHGIVFESCTNCQTSRNYIHDIEAVSDDGVGIAIWNSHQIQIDSCIVDNCETHGIDIWQSDDVYIDFNTILQAQDNHGINIGGASSDHFGFTNNIIAYNNEYGIQTNGLTIPDFVHHHNCFYQNSLGSINGYNIGANSFEADPQFVDIMACNYFLLSNSPCLGAGEGGVDIGAMGEWTHIPATLYVPSQYPTIQQAVDAAFYSDTIRVDAGTFPITKTISNTSVSNLHFKGSREEDGSNATIITTDLAPGTLQMFRFFNVHGCAISGFEVMNGSEGIIFDYSGQCECTENYLHDNGIGLAIWNTDDVGVSHNILDQNTTQGIDIWQSNDVNVDHNTILASQTKEGINIGGVMDDLTIKNNILASHAEEGIETNGLTFTSFSHDYNCFYENVTGNISGYSIGANSIIGDPMFQDYSSQNFYLQTGSPCLGSGEGGSDMGALGEYGSDVNDPAQKPPTEFALHQNYPNPFNPNTIISYSIPRTVQVHLSIYNLRGEKIITLMNGQKSPGHYQVEWDGKDMSGNPVASGIYLYRIKAGQFVMTRKMLFVR